MTELRWLGRGVGYREAHALQQELLAARIAGDIGDVVLLLEHAETITVGRKAGALANVLDAGDVPVVEVERGGDVTWHGPGQLVAYPIVGVRDLHAHLRWLEQAVIGVLEGLGLTGVRDPRNSGVWLGGQKVCSVGIACRRWVAWHGLALNVDPDLERFRRIRPCGFEPEVMTRISDHLADPPSLESLVEPLGTALIGAGDGWHNRA